MAANGNGDDGPPPAGAGLPVPDLRTMEELCQPSLNGRDTFYNGLTLRHRDTINAAAGGTFMKRRPEECYDLIENMTAHHNDWDTFAQRNESSSSTTSSNPEIAALCLIMAKINRNLMKNLFKQTNKHVTFNLDQTSRYSANYNYMTANQIDVIDIACEEYSQEVLGFSDVITSGNPTPYYDRSFLPLFLPSLPSGIVIFFSRKSTLSSLLKMTQLHRKLITLLRTLEGDILLLEAFLNDDPSLPPPTQGNYFPEIQKELKVCEAKNDKSSIDEPPNVELKDLHPHLEYAFLEGDDKFLVHKLLRIEVVTFKFPSTLMIKKRQHSRVLTERSPTVACLLAYAMHRARSKDKMLQRCENTNLCLNWEKSHFMVKEGIVLCHKISKNGIEVDKAKFDVIAKIFILTYIKGVSEFSRSCSSLRAS
ncbi:hypothetical protein Tco_0662641 [Tanacetum coccineum]